jgi:uncharacterized membrane protein YhhN
MLVATILCGIATCVLVAAELRRAPRLRAISKTIASLAFIAVGVLAGPGDAYARWILIGLVFGAVGDVALLGKSDTAFLAGLGAFLVGHLGYVIAAAQLVPPARWLAQAGALAIAPPLVGVVVLIWLWRRLGSMKVPVIVYVLTIVAMVIGALAAPLPLLRAGAVLFFASDLAVAKDKFVGADVINRVWGLPCYYAAQLLIAWSLAS